MYLVARASIEPNFHVLYLGLLDAIGDETLFRLVLDASYSNIKALLSSNKVKTNSVSIALLKNLGSWLGNLTISRNQPVLMRDLDLKALVLESYQTGHMIAVIPFVAKVLEPAKDSIIFKPPNPWTAAVLGLLKEIYSERDLKLNLKFEMERLFKHLEVEIKDQKPSYLLHQVRRDRVNNPDFVADKNSAVDSRGGLGAMAGSGGSLGSMTGVGTPYEPAAMGSPNPGIGAPGPGPSGGHGVSRGDAFAQQGGLSGGLSGADDAAAGGLQQHIKIGAGAEPARGDAQDGAGAPHAGGADGGGAGNRVAGGGALGDHRVHDGARARAEGLRGRAGRRAAAQSRASDGQLARRLAGTGDVPRAAQGVGGHAAARAAAASRRRAPGRRRRRAGAGARRAGRRRRQPRAGLLAHRTGGHRARRARDGRAARTRRRGAQGA